MIIFTPVKQSSVKIGQVFRLQYVYFISRTYECSHERTNERSYERTYERDCLHK
jgi:hypothetical protein